MNSAALIASGTEFESHSASLRYAHPHFPAWPVAKGRTDLPMFGIRAAEPCKSHFKERGFEIDFPPGECGTKAEPAAEQQDGVRVAGKAEW